MISQQARDKVHQILYYFIWAKGLVETPVQAEEMATDLYRAIMLTLTVEE